VPGVYYSGVERRFLVSQIWRERGTRRSQCHRPSCHRLARGDRLGMRCPAHVR